MVDCHTRSHCSNTTSRLSLSIPHKIWRCVIGLDTFELGLDNEVEVCKESSGECLQPGRGRSIGGSSWDHV